MRDVLLNERSLESTHDEDSSKWIDTQPNKVVPVSSRRSSSDGLISIIREVMMAKDQEAPKKIQKAYQGNQLLRDPKE